MSDSFLFPIPPAKALAVRGSNARIPIRRIFCVGRNYAAHAREMGVAPDLEAPFYFTKAASHYVPSGSVIAYPPGTANCHYEMELVIVIGASAFQVPVEKALDAVFGYACGLDMTRRDLQFAARDQKRSWDLGKDFENSAVVSEVVPASEIGHPSAGKIELRVNGQTKQNSDISDLIHGIPQLVSHLSNYYHLEPGDLIFTGTPEGVGPIVTGDEIEGSVAGVGSVRLSIGAPATSRLGQLAGRLLVAADGIVAEANSLPAALVTWKPAPDVWSVMEILCHVAEFIPFWTSQGMQMIVRPTEQWGRTHTDTDRLAAVGRASQRTLDDLTAEILSGARASASTLLRLKDADLDVEAESRNPRWGRKPALFVFDEMIVAHVLKHTGQVKRNRGEYKPN